MRTEQVFGAFDTASARLLTHALDDFQGGVHAEIGFDQHPLELIKKRVVHLAVGRKNPFYAVDNGAARLAETLAQTPQKTTFVLGHTRVFLACG